MRVCQPSPVARNAAMTSASYRTLICSFGISLGGLPIRLRSMSSDKGRIALMVSVGTSAESNSCSRSARVLLRLLIVSYLSRVSFAKADPAHGAVSKREGTHVQSSVDIAESTIAFFAVVAPRVDFIPDTRPIESARVRQRNPIVAILVDGVLGQIECNFHLISV